MIQDPSAVRSDPPLCLISLRNAEPFGAGHDWESVTEYFFLHSSSNENKRNVTELLNEFSRARSEYTLVETELEKSMVPQFLLCIEEVNAEKADRCFDRSRCCRPEVQGSADFCKI